MAKAKLKPKGGNMKNLFLTLLGMLLVLGRLLAVDLRFDFTVSRDIFSISTTPSEFYKNQKWHWVYEISL